MLVSTVGRSLSALVMGIACVMLLSPQALAHSNEVSADPAADSVLGAMPEVVSLTFDDGLLEAGAALVVTAEDGTVVSGASPVIDDRTITATITEGGPGTYEVAYRVVSGDGHPVTGTYAFTVTGDSSQSSQSPESRESPESPQANPMVTSGPTSVPTTSAQAEGTGLSNAMLIALGGASLGLLAVVVVVVVRRLGQPR